MDRYLIRKSREDNPRDHEVSDQPSMSATKRPRTASTTEGSRMRQYKNNLRYDLRSGAGWSITSVKEVCSAHIVRSTANLQWLHGCLVQSVTATELLNKHEKADWHLASVEARMLAESAKKNGDVVEKMLAATKKKSINKVTVLVS